MDKNNSFQTKSSFKTEQGFFTYYSLKKLSQQLNTNFEKIPFSIRILIENLLRNEDNSLIKQEDIVSLSNWNYKNPDRREIPFLPARVLMQDFTGVPAIVDLAAMREAIKDINGSASKVNPIIPVDLIIDHSVQIDSYGLDSSFQKNLEKEYFRNTERYSFLKWAQSSFKNFNVIPPATGICHQVNLEYLANVVCKKTINNQTYLFPDTLVGMDSHTTMINCLGVMGWGVGGIEAEAVMLGEPYYLITPQVVGFELIGELPDNVYATDLVLTITEMLRKQGVVGKFVEFFGSGLKYLSLADRSSISNMAPEYGATMGFFPVDDETIKYLTITGRNKEHIKLVEKYYKEQGLFRTDNTITPDYCQVLSLDISTVKQSLAGPKRPQDRILLSNMKKTFNSQFGSLINNKKTYTIEENQLKNDINNMNHGAVVIASITSCTNTSNPSVLLGAGLIAKNAVEKGLKIPGWVKTSFAPGSKVVVEYLRNAGLLEYLEKLGFNAVAFGCATCIGNSGPLDENVVNMITKNNLVTTSVSSGNRNFEGRINPLTMGNYLTSPILVVAYAITGTVDIDLENEPIGYDKESNAIFLKDIWPKKSDVEKYLSFVEPQMYIDQYKDVYKGDEKWQSIKTTESNFYKWSDISTYIKKPPFFEKMLINTEKLSNISNARAIVMLGNTVTTDHISPAGAIPNNTPSSDYLINKGIEIMDFNSFGSRRGNHEVMMRGTFGNVRLKNKLVNGVEGGWTRNYPSGEQMSIFDSAMRSKEDEIPLIVLAGKEYGTGSSRDWAAKGTLLIGIKAVLAQSFERIHRSNLIGMGVLPLQFKENESIESLGIEGNEIFNISGIEEGLAPAKELTVTAAKENNTVITFNVICRIDSNIEVKYYLNGGILPFVLRKMVNDNKK